MLENDVIEMLTLILVDDRHDWSRDGATIALLEYSKKALKNQKIADRLEHNRTLDKLVFFVKVSRDMDTRLNLYEAIQLLRMLKLKKESIAYI